MMQSSAAEQAASAGAEMDSLHAAATGGELEQHNSFASAASSRDLHHHADADDGGGSDVDGVSGSAEFDDAVSAQPSKGSALSGAPEQGETFFTALRHQCSWHSDAADVAAAGGDGEPAGLEGHATAMQSGEPSRQTSLGQQPSLGSGRTTPGDGGSISPTNLPALPAAGSWQDEQGGAGDGNAADDAAAAGDGQRAGVELTTSVLDVLNSLYEQQQPDPAGPAAADADGAAGLMPCADESPRSSRSSMDGDDDGAAPSSEAPSHAHADQQDQGGDGGDGGDLTQPPDAVHAGAQDGTALLAHVDGLLSARAAVTAQLGSYLDSLSAGEGRGSGGSNDDGSSGGSASGPPLVELPADFDVLVERLLRAGRAQQYRALEGWPGPRRYEELPVARLSADCGAGSGDLRVAAGLAAIRRLDEELRDASMKAFVAARAADPQHWADAEQRRLQRRAADIDAALAAERARRQHAAKLRRALTDLDAAAAAAPAGNDAGGTNTSAASFSGTTACGDARSVLAGSYYRLQPHEEVLLDAVMRRDDAELEAADPFDPLAVWGVEAALDGDAADSGSVNEPTGAAATTAQHAHEGSAASGEPTCGGPDGSSSSGGWLALLLRRPSTAGSRADSSSSRETTLSLAEIDARLEAINTERTARQQQQQPEPGVAVSAAKSRTPGMTSRSSSGQGSRTLSAQSSDACRGLRGGLARGPTGAAGRRWAAAAASSANSSTRRSSPDSSAASSRGPGGSSITSGGPARSGGSSSVVAASVVASQGSSAEPADYLSEARAARKARRKEAEIDAWLRRLQTSALPARLEPAQLAALLRECA